jgi:hypothetical protein
MGEDGGVDGAGEREEPVAVADEVEPVPDATGLVGEADAPGAGATALPAESGAGVTVASGRTDGDTAEGLEPPRPDRPVVEAPSPGAIPGWTSAAAVLRERSVLSAPAVVAAGSTIRDEGESATPVRSLPASRGIGAATGPCSSPTAASDTDHALLREAVIPSSVCWARFDRTTSARRELTAAPCGWAGADADVP